MKNLGRFLVGYVIATLFVLTLCVSCDYLPTSPKENYDVADSTLIAAEVQSVLNPSFTEVETLLYYRQTLLDEAYADSVFLSMPETILANVANVVLKKKGIVDEYSIVSEYRANRDIYDNLPDSQTSQQTNNPQEVDLGSTDLGNRREDNILSTSYRYVTDTIDGKPVKIKIKEEKSYAE